MTLRSIDPPRPRRVAPEIEAFDGAGDSTTVRLRERTLIIAVKASCDGCRRLLEAGADFFGLPLMALCADDATVREYADLATPVRRAPEWLGASGVSAAPFFLVVETDGTVVTEGIPFDPRQVRGEVAGAR